MKPPRLIDDRLEDFLDHLRVHTLRGGPLAALRKQALAMRRDGDLTHISLEAQGGHRVLRAFAEKSDEVAVDCIDCCAYVL